MSFTNSFYDESKVKQHMEENTYIGQYTFHVPGNAGTKPSFIEDPHIRLTKWGANRWTNNIYVEDQLKNRNRTYGKCRHEYTMQNLRENIEGNSNKLEYQTNDTLTTEQSRTTHPAWLIRDSTASSDVFTKRHFPL